MRLCSCSQIYVFMSHFNKRFQCYFNSLYGSRHWWLVWELSPFTIIYISICLYSVSIIESLILRMHCKYYHCLWSHYTEMWSILMFTAPIPCANEHSTVQGCDTCIILEWEPSVLGPISFISLKASLFRNALKKYKFA